MTDALAILIEPDGEVTTPHFAGLAEPDHAGGGLWHICNLIDTTAPDAIELPNSGGLVLWIDGRAHDRMRNVNMVASIVIAAAFELRLQTIRGPLLITGGSAGEPRALTAAQVAAAFERLDLEPVDVDVDAED